MPVCPNCNTDYPKLSKGGCPGCHSKLIPHGGYWYRAEDGNPAMVLIQKFEDLVSSQLSAGKDVPVSFRFIRKGARWKREMISASRLLDMADGNLALALEALNILFIDRRFFKKPNTLMYLDADYNVALSIARAALEAREKADKVASDYYAQVQYRESLFQ